MQSTGQSEHLVTSLPRDNHGSEIVIATQFKGPPKRVDIDSAEQMDH